MNPVLTCGPRCFGTSTNFLKKIPDKMKGRSTSSQGWLIRQMNDPYVKKAKLENYRARSAYKLLELQARLTLMSPGHVVVECGAAPGAWSQVALRAVNADARDAALPVGHVIGVDLLTVRPLPPAVHLQGDFTSAETQRRLVALLPAAPHLVLSDMAPAASGVRQLDHECIVALCVSVARFGVRQLAPGGSLLMKLWAGAGEAGLRQSLAPFFGAVRLLRPSACRSDSSELYLAATGFVGASLRSVETSSSAEAVGAAETAEPRARTTEGEERVGGAAQLEARTADSRERGL